jgi:hypothetical protein
LLRVTEINESGIKFLLRDGTVLLDLVVGQSLVLIKQEQNNGLVTVGYESVILSLKDWLNFNLTMLVQPCEIPVLMLVLVELLELGSDFLHLWW